MLTYCPVLSSGELRESVDRCLPVLSHFDKIAIRIADDDSALLHQ